MTKGLTSIIMVCYDQIQTSRNSSMEAVADITRYTDSKDYELIIIDCEPKFPFRDDFKCLKIDKFIEVPSPDIGYYPAMNKGAKEAKGEYLCFIDNDIFVHEGWLKDLRWYLEKDLLDAVMPDQIPCSRAQQLYYYSLSLEDAIGKGCAEQGLILIKRNFFDKMGGWDKKLTKGYGWKRFYLQMNEVGARYNNTAKVNITHLMGMTYYNTIQNDYQKYLVNSKEEADYNNG